MSQLVQKTKSLAMQGLMLTVVHYKRIALIKILLEDAPQNCGKCVPQHVPLVSIIVPKEKMKMDVQF